MSELIDTFSNRLSKALTIRDIKPVELSERTGIDKSKISSYMSGRYKAKQDRCIYIVSIFKRWPCLVNGIRCPYGKRIKRKNR